MEARRYPFRAMGCPCELQLYPSTGHDVDAVARAGVAEVRRLEAKFTRFRDDSLTAAINRSAGDPEGVVVDDETASPLGLGNIGYESLGKYVDFRANGFVVFGGDNETLSNNLVGTCEFIGHNILVTRERQIESAFSGADVETGGPLPYLGHYGINGFIGAYYLNNDVAGDTVGVSARAEALVTESVTANVTYTNDDILGANAWVNVAFTMPQWRTRGWFKPRVMKERLGEQVRRSSRIHTSKVVGVSL